MKGARISTLPLPDEKADVTTAAGQLNPGIKAKADPFALVHYSCRQDGPNTANTL